MQQKGTTNGVIEVFPTRLQLVLFLVISTAAFLGLAGYEFTLKGKTAEEERRRAQTAVYFNTTSLSALSQFEDQISAGIAGGYSAVAGAAIEDSEIARAKAVNTVELTNSKALSQIYSAIGAEGQAFIRGAASDWKLARMLEKLDATSAQSLLGDLISDAEPQAATEPEE